MMNWITKFDKLVIEEAEDIAVQLEGTVYHLWQGASKLVGSYLTEGDAKVAGEAALDERNNPKPVVEPVVQASPDLYAPSVATMSEEPAPETKQDVFVPTLDTVEQPSPNAAVDSQKFDV